MGEAAMQSNPFSDAGQRPDILGHKLEGHEQVTLRSFFKAIAATFLAIAAAKHAPDSPKLQTSL
jgi:hypothetical protein